MTHEEKLSYMRIAMGITGYSFDEKGLDMLISMYHLVTEKKGDCDLDSIVFEQSQVERRQLARDLIAAKKEMDKKAIGLDLSNPPSK